MKQAIVLAVLAVLAGALACQRGSNDANGQSAKTAATPDPEPARASNQAFLNRMDQQLNPDNRAPYAGAVGTVKGRVTVTGDAPPPHPVAGKLPVGRCFAAHETYGKLFRIGAQGALADVLVAVTEYQGYLPPATDTVRVVAKDCAFQARTIALRLGQTLVVDNHGPGAVTPDLSGVKSSALLIAMPGGDGVPLRADRPGLYQLVDRSNDFATADVYVLSYPTTDVTGLDGNFQIEGVPIGEVKVSALLPSTGQTLEQRVQVQANRASELTFQFEFDLEQYQARVRPSGSAPEPGTGGQP